MAPALRSLLNGEAEVFWMWQGSQKHFPALVFWVPAIGQRPGQNNLSSRIQTPGRFRALGYWWFPSSPESPTCSLQLAPFHKHLTLKHDWGSSVSKLKVSYSALLCTVGFLPLAGFSSLPFIHPSTQMQPDTPPHKHCSCPDHKWPPCHGIPWTPFSLNLPWSLGHFRWCWPPQDSTRTEQKLAGQGGSYLWCWVRL